MENLFKIKIVIVLTLFSCQLYAQKIDKAEHGQKYREIKEMNYYDYKDNCRRGEINFYIQKRPHPILFTKAFKNYCYASSDRNSYLFSDFMKKMCRTSYANLYREEIFEKLIKKDYAEYIRADGKKISYEYLMLYLEKFEIISNYIRELYNYSIEKEKQEKQILKENEKVSKIKIIEKNKINQQGKSEVNEIIDEKNKAIEKLKLSFDEKIKVLKGREKVEIKNLPMKNYSMNKQKVVKKYAIKIAELRRQKEEDVRNAEVFWEDKINLKKENIEENISKKLFKLSNEEIRLHNEKREEIKNNNNLDRLREDIESSYEKAILEIDKKLDEKIKSLK